MLLLPKQEKLSPKPRCLCLIETKLQPTLHCHLCIVGEAEEAALSTFCIVEEEAATAAWSLTLKLEKLLLRMREVSQQRRR